MFKWIFSFSEKRKDFEAMSKKYLIVGLGNVGPDYVNTRHNIGFKLINFYAKSHSLQFESSRLGSISKHKLKGKILVFLKPNTYMNNSGKSVKYWLQKEKIPMENLLIVTDDLNLPFGTIRLKIKGSDGGHNGLKDIQEKLKTSNFQRLRFGIGNKFSKGKQVEFVLSEWTQDEKLNLEKQLETFNNLVVDFVFIGINKTMNKYN